MEQVREEGQEITPPSLDPPNMSRRWLAKLPLWPWPAIAVAIVAITGELGGDVAALIAIGTTTATAIFLIGDQLLETRAAKAKMALASFAAAAVLVLVLTAQIEGFSRREGDLRGIAVTQDVASEWDLQGANLAGATLERLDLRSASFAGATAPGASFAGARVDGVNLRGANLAGANFTDACLKGADLTGAVLSGANVTRANLSGAKISAESKRHLVGLGASPGRSCG